MSSIVAKNARRIIREKGLKQRHVAEKSHFNEKILSAMLCGRKTITAEHVVILCEALGVNADELFRDTA